MKSSSGESPLTRNDDVAACLDDGYCHLVHFGGRWIFDPYLIAALDKACGKPHDRGYYLASTQSGTRCNCVD